MKKREARFRHFCPPGARALANHFRTTAEILCVVLGCSLLGACLVAPTAIATSAVVTTAGLVTELVKAGQKTDDADSVTVQGKADVYDGPGEEYSLIATLHEGDDIKVLRQEDDWIHCWADQFESGWIRQSCIPSCDP